MDHVLYMACINSWWVKKCLNIKVINIACKNSWCDWTWITWSEPVPDLREQQLLRTYNNKQFILWFGSMHVRVDTWSRCSGTGQMRMWVALCILWELWVLLYFVVCLYHCMLCRIWNVNWVASFSIPWGFEYCTWCILLRDVSSLSTRYPVRDVHAWSILLGM